MMTLPKEFSKQISEFAPLFSKKIFEHAKVLLTQKKFRLGTQAIILDWQHTF